MIIDLERNARDETLELSQAFEAMVQALPAQLSDWKVHFTAPKLSERQIQALLSRGGFEACGERAKELASFGLSPKAFAEAFGGYFLLFKNAGRIAKPASAAALPAIESGAATISLEGLVGQTLGTPGLLDGPGEREIAAAEITAWTLRALAHLPYLIPGFRVDPRPTDCPLAVPDAAAGMGLAARWSTLR